MSYGTTWIERVLYTYLTRLVWTHWTHLKFIAWFGPSYSSWMGSPLYPVRNTICSPDTSTTWRCLCSQSSHLLWHVVSCLNGRRRRLGVNNVFSMSIRVTSSTMPPSGRNLLNITDDFLANISTYRCPSRAKITLLQGYLRSGRTSCSSYNFLWVEICNNMKFHWRRGLFDCVFSSSFYEVMSLVNQ